MDSLEHNSEFVTTHLFMRRDQYRALCSTGQVVLVKP